MHTRRKQLWGKTPPIKHSVLTKSIIFCNSCNMGYVLHQYQTYTRTSWICLSIPQETALILHSSLTYLFQSFSFFMNIGTWDIKEILTIKIPNLQTYTELLSCDFQFLMYTPTATAAGCTRSAAVTTCKCACSDCCFLNWNSANFRCLSLLCGYWSTNSCLDKW